MKSRSFVVFTFSLLFVLASTLLPAQKKKTDSLILVLKTAHEDTNKVNTLTDLCSEYRLSGETDQALEFGRQARKLSESLKWEKGTAKSLSVLGSVYLTKGNYDKSLESYTEALQLEIKIGNKAEIAKRQGNLGVVYKNLGNYSKALEYYFKSLKSGEELKEKNIVSTALGNIGNIYKEQGDFEKALEYYSKALSVSEEIGDKSASARHLGNMGTAFLSKNNYEKALDCFSRALGMAESLGYKQLQANTLGNIGNVYKEIGDSLIQAKKSSEGNLNYKKALDYYEQSYSINVKEGNRFDMAVQLLNISGIYLAQKNYKAAEEKLLQALAISQKLKALNQEKNEYQKLSLLYSESGNYKLSLEYYKKYVETKEIIANDENTKKQTRAEMQYVFDKKTTSDSIKNAEQQRSDGLKHKQEIQQQKIYTYGGIIGFVLMIVVAGVSFRAYRQKQKANEVISKQKAFMEEKQKEILASIQYARRIQKSLLPTEPYIDKNMNRLKKGA